MSNPHAFPTQLPALDPRSSLFYTEEGMTLRDYFAAKALQGMLSSATMVHDIAGTAYDYADAMLKAREEKRP